jgi:hypothetical protein
LAGGETVADADVTVRGLNRALLARQGLLERLTGPVTGAVESIGAVQAQQWSAPPVALWSRVAGFRTADLHAALEAGELVVGTLLRGTLHLTSAAHHPAYAVTAAASGATDWHRTKAARPAGDAALAGDLRGYAATQRTPAEVAGFAADWAAAHPDAIAGEERAFQAEHGWRPVRTTADLVRRPGGGQWAKDPKDFLAAPPTGGLAEAEALRTAARRHLAAFGPATADDVAYWLGLRTPVARTALADPELVTSTGPDGATLYDVPDGPRPAGDTPAPVRFLAAFDSALLAFHASRRDRILPVPLKDAVYVKANLQVKPTFLVDGFVAGTWTVKGAKRSATLTLTPGAPLSRAHRRELDAEAERLLEFLFPGAAPRIDVAD